MKIGDRVRYIGPRTALGVEAGDTGTVENAAGVMVWVKGLIDPRWVTTVHRDNLEIIPLDESTQPGIQLLYPSSAGCECGSDKHGWPHSHWCRNSKENRT